MKSICKAESKLSYSRNEHPNRQSVKKGFTKWIKRQMNKAKRRFYKRFVNLSERV